MDIGGSLPIALLVGALGAASTRLRWAFPGRLAWVVESVAAGLIVLGYAWAYFVTIAAPEAYLDEAFHVPQAQEYCRGRFDVWDPKITTPPGLYLLSYAASVASRAPCSLATLRTLNVAAVVAVFHAALRCRFELEAQRSTSRALSTHAVHSAANMALFPVLFFFAAMYYTDVCSAAAVLLALAHTLRRIRLRREGEGVGVASDAGVVVLGAAALLMRQTNVFWVVVFNGGLEAVDAVKTIKAPRPEVRDARDSLAGRLWLVLGQYAAGHVHDPLLCSAWGDDLVYAAASIAVAAVSNPLAVLRRTWPYVSLLGFFGVFVALNGGVVLGDKANHVATLHFTQMLYIWPFFAFFLAPLLVPAALQMLTNPLDVLGLSSIPEITATTTPESAKGTSSSPFLAAMARISSTKPFRPLVALGTVALFALVIRFNTIIHPFTLADNRHYMFYIFRHFIRRSAALRLALAVSYALCLRLSWAALFNPSVEDRHLTTLKLCRDRFVNHPFLPAPQPCPLAQEPDKVHPNRTTAALVPLDARESRASEPVAASTALLAIAASALSLVTAPLVEPRYFIVPWMVWRLLVPAWTPRPRSPSSWTPSWLAAFAQKHDVRLFAETAWFAAVNLATMFVFVAWPYVWRAEDGALLDGGRVQHFMW